MCCITLFFRMSLYLYLYILAYMYRCSIWSALAGKYRTGINCWFFNVFLLFSYFFVVFFLLSCFSFDLRFLCYYSFVVSLFFYLRLLRPVSSLVVLIFTLFLFCCCYCWWCRFSLLFPRRVNTCLNVCNFVKVQFIWTKCVCVVVCLYICVVSAWQRK